MFVFRGGFLPCLYSGQRPSMDKNVRCRCVSKNSVLWTCVCYLSPELRYSQRQQRLPAVHDMQWEVSNKSFVIHILPPPVHVQAEGNSLGESRMKARPDPPHQGHFGGTGFYNSSSQMDWEGEMIPWWAPAGTHSLQLLLRDYI